ncbi:hypothetical protein [Bdellovibrio bacteriovorus]|uniref:hypothetical protein n=1 Tax=Bdellovibrio bacteriovorus TaxID=959 RepID=UPI00130E9E8A|nr:hypothetical protein [Bdellovibrio bacteriovorus]
MRRSSRRATTRIDNPRLHLAKQFGGKLLRNSHAKTARPLSLKKTMHVVLSSESARGEWAFEKSKNKKIIETVLKSQARKYGISLNEIACAGESLHVRIRLRKRRTFAPFIRAVSGMLALMITGAGKTRKLKKKFWDQRPWTRILEEIRGYSVIADREIFEYLKKIGLQSQSYPLRI